MDAPRSSCASLKPALLARKGGAKPAMRPQLAAFDPAPEADLGWNDFGPEADADSCVVPIKRAVARFPRAHVAAEVAATDGRKAAFTLRLDPERHLKLRLACTVGARSAQAVVTEALDRLLGAMPELDPLVREAATARGTKTRPAKA